MNVCFGRSGYYPESPSWNGFKLPFLKAPQSSACSLPRLLWWQRNNDHTALGPDSPLHNTGAGQQAECKTSPRVQGFAWKHCSCATLRLASVRKGRIRICKCAAVLLNDMRQPDYDYLQRSSLKSSQKSSSMSVLEMWGFVKLINARFIMPLSHISRTNGIESEH